MNKGRFYTFWFSAAALCVILLYDGYAYLRWGAPATISRLLLGASNEHPAIPLFAGGLLAHLFWPGATPIPPKWQAGLAVAVLCASEAVFGLGHLSLFPLWTVVVGFLLGRLIVPQSKRGLD